MSNNQAQVNMPEQTIGQNYFQWVMVAGLVYLLICAVGMIGGGFKMFAGDQAKELF